LPIPRLLKLFDRYAEKITNARPVLTSTGLDLVSAGEEIDQVPDGIFAAIWAYDTYADAPMAIYPDSDGVVIRKQLLDFDLTVLDSREGYCLFQIASAELRWRGRYAIGDFPLIAVIRQDEPPLAVEIGRESMPIAEYLNDALPSFYRTDLSRVEGTSLYPERSSLAAFDVEKIRTVDWDRAGIDCKSEKTRTTKGESLFEWVVMRAREMGDGLIYCDDGPGEVADFITSNLNTANPVVRFYHCKSSQDEPGARQSDFYEVLGQAMRTSPWFDLDKLERQIRYRLQTSVPGFREGGDIELRWMREPGLNARVKFEVYVVQPGLNKGRVSAQMLEQFAGVANHLHAGGAEEFAIFASKIEENDV
jgi:hypothetical protein